MQTLAPREPCLSRTIPQAVDAGTNRTEQNVETEADVPPMASMPIASMSIASMPSQVARKSALEAQRVMNEGLKGGIEVGASMRPGVLVQSSVCVAHGALRTR